MSEGDAGVRHAWVDASAGVAGDMLLGALVDAGAELEALQHAVDAVVPGSVRLVHRRVSRAGIAAAKVDVEVLVEDPPHRTWRTIEALLEGAELPVRVRRDALAVFERLAQAEAKVHGVPPSEVHFHEVGALDSLADVVGVCAALHALGIATLSASEVALGSGQVRSAHGQIPVPVPAVAELSRGWRVRAGGNGELTTPTGMALVRALSRECAALPAMTLDAVGLGAGSRDVPGRPNVTRVLVGTLTGAATGGSADPAVLVQANVDDLDPRLWPGVLARLLEAGAADAWLVPIVMKKGRPAHTLSVLCHPGLAELMRETVLTSTSTIGVRQQQVDKYALPRVWLDVPLDLGLVAVKVAHRDGVILQVTPEFSSVADYAERHGVAPQLALTLALLAADRAGLRAGAVVPASGRSHP